MKENKLYQETYDENNGSTTATQKTLLGVSNKKK